MKIYGQIYRNTPYDESTKLYGIYEISQFYATHMYKNEDELDGSSYCICFVTNDGEIYYIRSEEGSGYPLYLANNMIQVMLQNTYIALDQYYMKVFSTNIASDLEDPGDYLE